MGRHWTELGGYAFVRADCVVDWWPIDAAGAVH